MPRMSLRSSGLQLLQFSSPLQLVVSRIVGIADLLAAIESRPVVGRQRIAVAKAARQVRIGNEDAAEREGIGLSAGARRPRAPASKPAGRNQHAAPDRPKQR